MFSTLDMHILEILCEDARVTPREIAVMTGSDEAQVSLALEGLKRAGVLVGYQTLINWERTDKEFVSAVIEVNVQPQREKGFDAIAQRIVQYDEVKSLYLMSGAYDLMVIVEGTNIKQLALFVAEKLSTIEHVLSTATHFVLKKYKQDGVTMMKGEQDDRLQVSP